MYRYGETHVEPAPLFDLDDGEPPADSIEVYFDSPISVHLLTHGATHSDDLKHLAAPLRTVRATATRWAVLSLQRVGGYVLDGHHGNQPVAARLEITALTEQVVPGEDLQRAHVHLYVGRTAQTIDDDTRWPVDPVRLHEGIDDAGRSYHQALMFGIEETFGFTLGHLPGRHPADKEIVDPPLHELVHQHQQVICPGPYGPGRQRIMADERWRKGIERDMTAIERHRAAG